MFVFYCHVKSMNFGFIILENQLFKVLMVNFYSTENSSVREVDFS